MDASCALSALLTHLENEYEGQKVNGRDCSAVVIL